MIHNLIVDYSKDSIINNIEHSKIESINTFRKRIKFYNPNVNEPLHKFWYHIPNAKLHDKDYNLISIVIPRTETKFLESIKSLDTVSSDIIKKTHKQCIVDPSIIISDNFPPLMSLIIDANSKCYDQDNNLIKHTNIKNESKLQIYVEFDMINFDNNVGHRKWRVIQLKETKNFDISVNLFESSLFLQPPPPPPPPPPPFPVSPIQTLTFNRPMIIKKEPVQEKKQSGFVAPSQSDLLNIIGRLRKAKSPTESEENRTGIMIYNDIKTLKEKIKISKSNREKQNKEINLMLEDIRNMSHQL